MKRITLLGVFLLFINLTMGQNYYMTNPEGFGAAATGGGTPTVSNTVTVTTYAELKAALTSTDASTSVILVSGVIDCLYTSVTLTNKTIIGLPGAKLRNTYIDAANCATSSANSGIINIKPGSDNVIIRNLTFLGPGAFDVDGRDNITNEGTNVWVDHCEFQDGMDGNFDNKGKADNVTISWCKFTYLKGATTLPTPSANGCKTSNDHRYSNLVGSNASDAPTDGRYSITFKNCYWAEGCRERMPRARNAELHLLNCYFKTSASSAKGVSLSAGNSGTTCYVENCNFEQIAKVSSPATAEGTGTVSLIFDNCIKDSPSTPVTGLDVGTAPAKPSYTYTVMPVTDVVTYVANSTCGAGAKLNVSSTGVISTSCTLSNDNYSVNLGKFYPTLVNDTLNIDLSDNTTGKAVIDIYTITGQKVYSYDKNVTQLETISIKLDGLSSGLYLCKLSIDKNFNSWKFMKK